MNKVSFCAILVIQNDHNKSAYVKPHCGHIGQADSDLGVDKDTPAVTAFDIPLQLINFIHH